MSISLPWALAFPTRPPLFTLSPQNMLDHVNAIIRAYNCILGTSTSMVLLPFLLSVNQSCLGTTLATNQRSYNGLIQLPTS